LNFIHRVLPLAVIKLKEREAREKRTGAKLFGGILCAVLFAVSTPTDVQQPKLPRIGFYRRISSHF
jgi:hypothetical protein